MILAIPAIPQNFNLSQGNGQAYMSWSIQTGATSYAIKRSTDGITYSALGTSVAPSYLDTTVSIGTQYWYEVASVNGSGTSAYCTPQSVVPTSSGDMSLGQVRLNAKQRADMVNSGFVTDTEWNSYIVQSYFELYDLLVAADEQYYVATPAKFNTDGTTFLYNLPNGVLSFTDLNGNAFVAKPFYKLMGVDLAINTANNAYVAINKFQFINRNRFIYPNSSSSIYGVFNMQYRLMGDKIEFIPTPSAGQSIRLWYIPRLEQPLADTDILNGVSGWLEYVIVDAAIKAMQKEESDVSTLMVQKQALTLRIQGMSVNRDEGQPDRISDIRGGGMWGNGTGGFGYNGPLGGY